MGGLGKEDGEETTTRILSPPAQADSPTSVLQVTNSPWVSSVISLDGMEGPTTLNQSGFANDFCLRSGHEGGLGLELDCPA